MKKNLSRTMSTLVSSVFLILLSPPILANGLHIPKPLPLHKIKLKSFDTIEANGHMYIKIEQVNSSIPDSVFVTGSNGQLVSVNVEGHTLYLTNDLGGPASDRPAIVTVKIHNLHELNVYGRASVDAKKLSSNDLNIHANSQGFVLLSGKIHLNQLYAAGEGNINISRIQTKSLDIYATGPGQIKLTGKAETLRARVLDGSKLNARYLRAGDVYVQAKGHAEAKVQPTNSLRAFAMNESNVYFYQQPKHLTRDTVGSGNVLQLAQF